TCGESATGDGASAGMASSSGSTVAPPAPGARTITGVGAALAARLLTPLGGSAVVALEAADRLGGAAAVVAPELADELARTAPTAVGAAGGGAATRTAGREASVSLGGGAAGAASGGGPLSAALGSSSPRRSAGPRAAARRRGARPRAAGPARRG